MTWKIEASKMREVAGRPAEQGFSFAPAAAPTKEAIIKIALSFFAEGAEYAVAEDPDGNRFLITPRGKASGRVFFNPLHEREMYGTMIRPRSGGSWAVLKSFKTRAEALAYAQEAFVEARRKGRKEAQEAFDAARSDKGKAVAQREIDKYQAATYSPQELSVVKLLVSAEGARPLMRKSWAVFWRARSLPSVEKDDKGRPKVVWTPLMEWGLHSRWTNPDDAVRAAFEIERQGMTEGPKLPDNPREVDWTHVIDNQGNLAYERRPFEAYVAEVEGGASERDPLPELTPKRLLTDDDVRVQQELREVARAERGAILAAELGARTRAGLARQSGVERPKLPTPSVYVRRKGK